MQPGHPLAPSSGLILITQDLSEDEEIVKIEVEMDSDPSKEEEVYEEPDSEPFRTKYRRAKTFTIGDKSNIYNICDDRVKRQAVELMEQGVSVVEVSRMMNIHRKNLIRWKNFGYERKSNAGRKSVDPKMEQELLKWLSSTYEENQCVPGSLIRKMAKSLTAVTTFMASKGWLARFCLRNNLRSRYNIY